MAAGFASSSSASATMSPAPEKASCYCALFLATLLVLGCCSCCCDPVEEELPAAAAATWWQWEVKSRPCDEIYVVGEGETLQTIGEKCGDPFIVEQNPHIQDPDDVFPGLVIKITPFIDA